MTTAEVYTSQLENYSGLSFLSGVALLFVGAGISLVSVVGAAAIVWIGVGLIWLAVVFERELQDSGTVTHGG